MNRRHILQSLAALPLLAGSGAAVARPPQPGKKRWTIIDRRQVTPADELVTFIHRSGIGPAGAFKVSATGHAMRVNSVKITYRGGETQTETLGLNLPEGQSSPPLTLLHDGLDIRRIDISFAPHSFRSQRSELLVWSAPPPKATRTVSR